MAMNPRLLRPTASGFNPATISGIVHWWDANDAATLTLNSGAVETWTSKAGTKTAASQSTANNRPVTTTVNGKTAIQFDGSNDGFNFTGTSRTDETWIIAAAQTGNSPSQQALVNDGGGGHGISAAAGSVKLFELSFAGGYIEGVTRLRAQYATPATVLMGPGVFTCVRSAAAGGFAFIDGTQRFSAINGDTSFTSSQATTIQRIGFYGPTLFQWNGWIGEILLYDRALSAAERNAVEVYLGRKWGIAVTTVPAVANLDAQDWINRVYANGGTVSASTASAVNTFCNAIDTAGIRDRFYRLNLFAGTGLNACLVPLYRGPSRTGTQYGNTTDTNNGPFVSGDYVETGASGGLTGANGKNISTGVQPLASGSPIAAFGFNALLSITRPAGRATVIGATDTNAFARIQLNEAAQVWGGWNRGSTIENVDSGAGTSPALFVLGRRTGNVDYLNVNGVDVTTVASTAADNTTAVATLFNSQTLRAGAYAIGGDVTGSQLLSFYNALRTFQNALSRNV
jgi:hypothetical protein